MAAHPEPFRRSPRALIALAVAAVFAVALASCGDDSSDDQADPGGATTSSTAAAAGADDYGGAPGDEVEGSAVVAKDFSLTSVTVAPGTETTFRNEGKASHTLTADDGSFDSGSVAAGSTATVTAPSEPGDYSFHCEIHPAMTGTLTVEG